MRNAKADFLAALSQCRDKKQESREIKVQNDLEREQIKKEERMAKSFRFTKMSKKAAFLPALHQHGQLQVEPITSVDQNTAFLDHRKKEALMFPDRTFFKEKRFSLTNTWGDYFSRPIGQEGDSYDDVMLRYMRK